MKTEVNSLLIKAPAGYEGVANQADLALSQTLTDACMASASYAVAEAYREEIQRLMKGALMAPDREAHLEWLAAAEQLVARFAAASEWIANQRAIVSPQLTQS